MQAGAFIVVIKRPPPPPPCKALYFLLPAYILFPPDIRMITRFDKKTATKLVELGYHRNPLITAFVRRKVTLRDGDTERRS